MSGVQIRMAGGVAWTPHGRTHEDLHTKPHITRLNGFWAVYYLIGRQTTIRCVVFESLSDVRRWMEILA